MSAAFATIRIERQTIPELCVKMILSFSHGGMLAFLPWSDEIVVLRVVEADDVAFPEPTDITFDVENRTFIMFECRESRVQVYRQLRDKHFLWQFNYKDDIVCNARTETKLPPLQYDWIVWRAQQTEPILNPKNGHLNHTHNRAWSRYYPNSRVETIVSRSKANQLTMRLPEVLNILNCNESFALCLYDDDQSCS